MSANATSIGRQLVAAADGLAIAVGQLREAQKTYLADRGNNEKGRAVADAAAYVDVKLVDYALARAELP